jgi:hypothetical protein
MSLYQNCVLKKKIKVEDEWRLSGSVLIHGGRGKELYVYGGPGESVGEKDSLRKPRNKCRPSAILFLSNFEFPALFGNETLIKVM